MPHVNPKDECAYCLRQNSERIIYLYVAGTLEPAMPPTKTNQFSSMSRRILQTNADVVDLRIEALFHICPGFSTLTWRKSTQRAKSTACSNGN